MAIKGYGPGTGRQFTPSINATWTEEFNELLKKYNQTHTYSRNRLTEKCIQLGMQALKSGYETPSSMMSGGVFIPSEELSEKQLEFLNSPEGKNTIVGIIKMLMLGEQIPVLTSTDGTVKAKSNNELSATSESTESVKTTHKKEEPQKKKADLNKLLNKNKKFGGISV